MKNKKNVSRRKFLTQTSLGLGAGIVGAALPSCSSVNSEGTVKLPREIIVASIDLRGLWPDSTRESRINRILKRMDLVTGINPDLVCLPELFDTMWVAEQYKISEVAESEESPGPVASRIAEYAVKNSCYVVCPIYTKKGGSYYNSSLLIDRNGKIAGSYNKIHPVKSEILPSGPTDDVGIRPGLFNQPAIETDFGKVGMQICYDANWIDGWENCKRNGAEIILFPSAFPGGRELNHYAQRFGCYIVSSTGQDARIIDMSGNDIDSSSTFVRYSWAKINLEKVNTDTWPTNDKLPEIFRKYGSRLEIKVNDNTSIITIASLDPVIRVMDIVREFGLSTVDENIRTSEEAQVKYRL
ncbi:MAG TPA: carbon-nitrogen hydrolase family protein [Bacteroidales bacterium]|nr:carbon-nitrogen hydrolase family protein [Bacteroidales bacterium]